MSANCNPQCESNQQCFQNQCYNLCSLHDCDGGEGDEICKQGLCVPRLMCYPACSPELACVNGICQYY